MSIIGWHWIRNDRRLGYGDGRAVVDGETLAYTGGQPIQPRSRGMHASAKIIDALAYAPGTVLCRVRLHGTVIKSNNKAVATHRTVLWSVDARKALILWAADCAERAISREVNPDPRSVEAIRVAREVAHGRMMAAYAYAYAYAAAAAYAYAYAAAAAAAYAAADAYATAADAYTAAADASHVERAWQSKRLRKYIAMTRWGTL